MYHQSEAQLPVHRDDSSFVPDQSAENHYVIRKEEHDSEHQHEQSPTKSRFLLLIDLFFLVTKVMLTLGKLSGTGREKIKHYLCCICCPCLPMWARYGCCVIFLLFILFLIIVGILAAIFKIPTVDFNGPTRHPDDLAPFSKSNDTLAFSVNFGLKIAIINDNLESITFESVRTVAYYPTAPNTPVGGGEIYNLNIKSYGISNFTFPFSIKYDPMRDEGYAMLIDIATKCGLLGDTNKEDLLIQYDIIPTVRIAGIAISPVIHQSSHFPCPISEGQLTMGMETNVNEESEDNEEEEEEE
ncbi:hypothetical protein INT47_004381 [Mucor saturninus]|uniref:Late embryogenesis abundant protein LEA-2 subgroup domain-containing protein n=1 Tax=Mucor saturninus TaxID=64648 RepID=A0A8H7QZT0_9FUNG|nr:hypothetical protein INT47_004381 [Mucor saturninus]